MRRIIVLVSILFLMGVFAYGYIYHDYSCIMYNQCASVSEKSTEPTLCHKIANAGVLFLKSNRDYQDYLQYLEESEFNEIDHNMLIEALDSAVKNMEASNSMYYEIWKESKTLEINPLVFQMLVNFDYSKYQEEKGFIPSIFNEVKDFLEIGNMSGIYEKSYSETGVILLKLKNLRLLAEANSVDLSLSWDINQQILKIEFFGQYVSQVFSEIYRLMR